MFSYYGKFINRKNRVLNRNSEFPLPEHVLKIFQFLKDDIKDATLVAINQNKDFQVKTGANDFCLVVTLSQVGRLVAFFSRTLSKSECHHHAIEKEEAAAIVEALRHWRHLLLGRKFTVVTVQKIIWFMYDKNRRSK